MKSSYLIIQFIHKIYFKFNYGMLVAMTTNPMYVGVFSGGEG